jgi:WD40 repeat protein
VIRTNPSVLLRSSAFFCVCLLTAAGQTRATRTVEAAATAGSTLVVAVDDDMPAIANRVFAFSLSDGHLIWSRGGLPRIHAIALNEQAHQVALGASGVSDSEPSLLIVDEKDGHTVKQIGSDAEHHFFPSQVQSLAFAPDGDALYALTDDGLAAWNTRAWHFTWKLPLPGGLPRTRIDTATSFALAPDGNTLGLNRFGRVFLINTDQAKPRRVRELPGDINNVGDQPAFSPDGKYFVTGFGYNSSFSQKAEHFGRGGLLWHLNGSKPIPVRDCGGYFAWTSDVNTFVCGNGSGSHLRHVQDPNKDAGLPAPASDLPFLTDRKGVWVAAYTINSWKDPLKPFALKLTEIGGSKQVTVMLPGR